MRIGQHRRLRPLLLVGLLGFAAASAMPPYLFVLTIGSGRFLFVEQSGDVAAKAVVAGSDYGDGVALYARYRDCGVIDVGV